MNKQKIAFVSPFDLDWLSGTPIRARTTIKAAAAFADVYVLAKGGDIPTINVTKANGGIFAFTRQALSFLRGTKPDAVHAFTTIAMASAIFYKIFYNRKVKVIFEMHGWAWFETESRMSIFKRLALLAIDTIGFLSADTLIAMSHSQKDFLEKRFGKGKKIEVLWGPVDFDIRFVALPIRDVVYIGYLGNSSFWQGLEVVIKAAQILEGNQKIKFMLAGFDHDDENRFPRLANVSYFGKIPRENVGRFIVDCDAMISARLKGKASALQFPHKLSEYLAFGRAVVSSSTNDEKRVIASADCGIICDPMDARSLSDAVLNIADMNIDERNTLGMNASKFAQANLSFDVFSGKLAQIYNR